MKIEVTDVKKIEAIEKLTTEETIEDVTVKENNDIKERSL